MFKKGEKKTVEKKSEKHEPVAHEDSPLAASLEDLAKKHGAVNCVVCGSLAEAGEPCAVDGHVN